MAAATTCRLGAIAASSFRQAGGSSSSNSSCSHLTAPRHQPAAFMPSRPARKRQITLIAARAQDPGRDAGAAASDGTAAAAAAAGDAAPAVQPLPSRLQREVDALVGLDVEYTHLRLPGQRMLHAVVGCGALCNAAACQMARRACCIHMCCIHTCCIHLLHSHVLPPPQ